MKRLYYIFLVLCAVAIASCNKDVEGVDSNTTTAPRTLSITTQAFEGDTSVATRGVDAVVEYTAMNYWVLQFGSNDNLISSKAEYVTDISTIIVDDSATTIWVVANTFDNSLFSSISSLSSFQTKYFSLITDKTYIESGMWETNSDTNYLRLSGCWTGSQDGVSLGIVLKPLAAKISFTYSCPDNSDDSWVEITSVQLNSVPQYCQYSTEANVNATSNMAYTPYQEYYVSNTDDLGEASGSFTFYLPQNLQGTSSSASAAEKSENAPDNATYIVINGIYHNRYYNSADDTDGEIAETPIIIKVYPGENSIDDYNVVLCKNYNVNCTISCNSDSWSVDSRVVTEVNLPEGAVIHYEFDPVDLLLNSAYNADGTTITACYTPDYDSNYPTEGGVVVSRNDGSPFIRNLAMSNDEYLTQYDCTEITDNKFSYLLDSNIEYTSQLSYIAGNKYVSSSLLALDTEWGSGWNPSSASFTIVFIGSSDDNVGADSNQNGPRHHIYTPGGSSNDHRWYFMKFNTGQMVYGLQGSAHQYVDDFVVNPNEVFLSFDIANSNENKRQVYFNNIKLTDATYTSFAFDRDFSIMGNIETTSGSSSPLEANDGRIYLFLIYEKVLSIEEITQIKNYATLKGLI